VDSIDRNILSAVQRNGKASLAEIGKAAGLSISATNERIHKLEDRGAIRGWQAVLDPKAAGCPVLAFVLLELRAGRDEDSFRKALRKQAHVQECHRVSGGYTHLLKLRVADIGALDAEVLTLRGLSGVVRVDTMLGLATVKETAAVPLVNGAG